MFSLGLLVPSKEAISTQPSFSALITKFQPKLSGSLQEKTSETESGKVISLLEMPIVSVIVYSAKGLADKSPAERLLRSVKNHSKFYSLKKLKF